MAWSLQSGNSVWKIGDSRIFGRQDFPDDTVFSRKHFTVYEQYGKVYIKDLGSRNGTAVNGRTLMADAPTALAEEDVVKVGEREFRVVKTADLPKTAGPKISLPTFSTGQVLIGSSLISFIVWGVFHLSRSEMAWGRALSGETLAMLCAILTLAASAPSICAYFLLPQFQWKPWTVGLFLAFTLGSTMFINDQVTSLAYSAFDLEHDLALDRVFYFCLRKFDGYVCANSLAACPTCAKSLSKEEKDYARAKLQEFGALIEAYNKRLEQSRRKPASH